MSLELLWRVSGGALECLWTCFGESLELLWRVFGAALECLWTCFGYSKVFQISLGKFYLSKSALRQTWALLIFDVFRVSRAT